MQYFLTHIKATMAGPTDISLPSLRGSVTEDNYTGFNVPFEHFNRFIQNVQYPKILQTVLLLHQESSQQDARRWIEIRFGKSSQPPLLNAFNNQEFVSEIENYEKHTGVSHLEKHFEPTPNPWSIQYYYKVSKKRGFYTTVAGIQGGGLIKRFHDEYDQRYNSFAFKDDFEFAYRCIELTDSNDRMKDVKIRRKNFKENFLETFESGSSYLYVEKDHL